MRKIELNDLFFHAYHGVSEEERRVGGNYRMDVVMEVDFTAAENSDSLEDTLNYEAVFATIEKEMKEPSKLLEHVAGRIIKSLRNEFRQIQTLEIRLSKLQPPVEGMEGCATVVIKV